MWIKHPFFKLRLFRNVCVCISLLSLPIEKRFSVSFWIKSICWVGVNYPVLLTLYNIAMCGDLTRIDRLSYMRGTCLFVCAKIRSATNIIFIYWWKAEIKLIFSIELKKYLLKIKRIQMFICCCCFWNVYFYYFYVYHQ